MVRWSSWVSCLGNISGFDIVDRAGLFHFGWISPWNRHRNAVLRAREGDVFYLLFPVSCPTLPVIQQLAKDMICGSVEALTGGTYLSQRQRDLGNLVPSLLTPEFPHLVQRS